VPIVITFDLARPQSRELNRIRGTFERLGWERLGNTAYRYPPLGEDASLVEDWFNHVIPALMMLRALALHSAGTGRGLIRYTIDAQSSTGFSKEEDVGMPPQTADEIDYSRPSPSGEAMSQRRLEDWLNGIVWPYAPEEDAP
jgi:hypothetical protein